MIREIAAPQIVVIGSYNRDVTLAVARLPGPGETCLSRGRFESSGGKGSNQAIQAARCGARVAMLAAIGDDSAADQALALWFDANIHTGGVVRIAGHATGTAVILVDDKGENSIVVDAGANHHLAPVHVENASALIASAKVVVAQLETPIGAIRKAFELARAAGAVSLLNAAPVSGALSADLLDLTDILVVNEVEGRALAGMIEEDDIGAALLRRVGAAVVMTLGERGALLFEPGQPKHSAPSHAVEVLDTTGAGDAFVGAFSARLARGDGTRAALEWGLAAGALACTARGACASFADLDRITALGIVGANLTSPTHGP